MNLGVRYVTHAGMLGLQKIEVAAQRIVSSYRAYRAYLAVAHARRSQSGDREVGSTEEEHGRFLAPTPNLGAGMGHQVVTWCAGQVLAEELGMRFVHVPVAEPWESHLNLAAGELLARDMRTTARTVHLPLIAYSSEQIREVDHRKFARVASAYGHLPAVVFRLALDQSRFDVTAAGGAIAEKYWMNRLPRPATPWLQIAVHIRRGDIVSMRNTNHGNWADRWLDLSYFENLLSTIKTVVGRRELRIVVVSEGYPGDFSRLEDLFGAELVLGGDPTLAFDRLVESDVLIASPSGFSFIAGMISTGVVLFPSPWWHSTPNELRWVPITRDPSTWESMLRTCLSSAAV